MSHFVTIKDISKYTILIMTIPILGERRHFDALNANNKVQIPISWSFGNFSFSHGSKLDTSNKNESLCYNQGYLEIYKFDYDDSKSMWNTTFWWTKYKQESPNSDFVKFWKLQFLPWVHSWTLLRIMSHFVTIKDISKYTNLIMTIPSLGERRHFDALNTNKKVKIPISWNFGNFSFGHGP